MTHTFEGPGCYRIVVKGRLDAGYSELLGGMRIASTEKSGSRGRISTLVGRLLDQSELVGILNTLYGMHLTILGVEALSNKEGCHETE